MPIPVGNRRFILRAPSKGGGEAFDLAGYMAGQADGLWFDFTKTDRTFQENVGSTPAASANQVIGLSLDQREWGGKTLAVMQAAASELVINGDFSSAASWSQAVGVTISGGVANFSGVDNANALTQLMSVATGLYSIGFTLVTRTASDIQVNLGPGGTTFQGGFVSVPGQFAYYGRSTVTDRISFWARNTGSNFSGSIDNATLKRISGGYTATQATTSLKPKVQTAGATFDGSDDRLACAYAAGGADNWVILPDASVPATLAATQVLAGAMDASANGCYLGITTAGALRVKFGATTLDSSGVDLRNGVHDLGFWTDGATLYLYADGVVVASGAWSGTRPATTWNIGAMNNNGTPGSFFGGALKAVLAGRDTLTLSRATQVANAA